MRVEKLAPYLSRYPNRFVAQFLWHGFKDVFPFPSSLSSIPPMSGNLKSAYVHPEVVSGEFKKEVSLSRMAGPFSSPPVDDLVVSPLGVVPRLEPN